ncbi:cation efflux system protein CusB precursor [Arenibacter sp. NBRC 103722]|uniref:efflux RND transporter periplasmic adaptor subunit n=1 Tax=Arenibacter sp. NBRC 103722 TaxID=1113929 RepID=UPI000853725F|nr:efflux RND transporter periplasmic adaptor subunit [Arenibacter sp. NBRC 103722]MDX1766444.1 efflux RND transporter periplasmic adaptor subunit [Arenibacter troitsensis]GBF21601.1 cation efflux system protein CusB precursor [Arenibacter sp. NBRC 103722]
MNKNIIYIGIAVLVGLLCGWLIFGGSAKESMSNKDASDMSDHNHSTESEQMWTCSMHPQIMQPEPGDCPICGMDLIPAETGAEGLSANEIKMTDNAMALANIRTTVVGTGSMDGNFLKLSGKIRENEEANAVQVTYFAGRIEKLYVNYAGERVGKGKLLATIYSPELVSAQQELLTAASMKETQPALYKAVRNKLKLWKLSDKQINSIEESGQVQENFPVYATVAGTVTEKMVEEGDYVKQGQPLYKIANLNSVWAVFDAYENQIASLKTGQEIKLTTNAYPNKEFDVTVSFIDPVLNTQTRTVTVRANLKNNNGIFKPGMFVTGKVKGKSNASESHLTIPASAVMWTGERSLVYIKTNPNEPIFEMREVTLGNRNGDAFTVVSGLQYGEEIVTNGTFTVDAAAQLQGKKSMMNQDNRNDDDQLQGMKMELPDTVQKALKESLHLYLKMKDAFIDSDVENVSAFAKATLEKINSIPDSKLGKMEKLHLGQVKKMLSAITENEDIENQRGHFVVLNQNLVPMVMSVDEMDPQVFVQKCPMANNNQGAFWISNQKEIRNPYYGDAMLTCGSVIDSIQ